MSNLVYRAENRQAAKSIVEELDNDVRQTTIRLGDRTDLFVRGDVFQPEIKYGKKSITVRAAPRKIISVKESPIKEISEEHLLSDGFRNSMEVAFTLGRWSHDKVTIDSTATAITSVALGGPENVHDYFYWLGRQSDLHGALPSQTWPDALYVRGLVDAYTLPQLRRLVSQEFNDIEINSSPDNRWYAGDDYDRMVNKTEPDN